MEAEKDIVLSVKHLTKRYKKSHGDDHDFYALKDLSFDLHRGEIMGVIGRNGAGKSTLLKLLSEITAPSSGEIRYTGKLTSIIDIGTGFHPDLSGKENVYLNASLLGYSTKETAAIYDTIVAFSGIGEYMTMPVKHYSSGMYLRLAFSIAFHIDIDILILDEVIAVGDIDFRRKCYQRIRQMKGEGVSILLVSHFLEPILEFCDRCLLINNGSVQQIGIPLDVVETYMQTIDQNSDAPIHQVIENKQLTGGFIKYNTNVIGFENEQIMLNDFKIYVNGQLSATSIGMSDELTLELTCGKRYSEGGLEIVYYLVNMNGVRVLLESYGLHDWYDLENQHLDAGNYSIKCVIPSDLLNRGMFTLGVIFCRNGDVIKEFENLARFRVDTTKKTKLDDKISSVIRPKFEWEVKQIS